MVSMRTPFSEFRSEIFENETEDRFREARRQFFGDPRERRDRGEKRDQKDQKKHDHHDLPFIAHHGKIGFGRQESKQNPGAVVGRDRDHIKDRVYEVDHCADQEKLSEPVKHTTGKIEKGMSKSKCAQLSRGIVMDDKSMIQAKPILLIDEFDCFANHGASIGKMSDEDLFYFWKNKWNYLYAALCGISGFMLVVGWQLVLNKIQFGSPFISPYSLHEYGPSRGFGLDVIPYGFKFLCHNNYIYVILGVSSLFFIPERKNRVLLTLWIFPSLLFLFGYPGIFNSPIRFILTLYPPLLAALVMNPIWQAAWIVRIKAALVLFSSCLLCKSDIFSTLFQPWNLGKFGISNTAYMVIQGVVCLFCCAVIISMRKELRTDYANTISHFRFLILYTAVFFLGTVCVYIAGILVLAAFVYGMRDTWKVILNINGRSDGAAPHGIPSRY